jgi:hypothetical protein
MSHSKFLSAIMNDDVDDFDMIEFVKLKREEREGRKREMEEVMLQQKKKIQTKKNLFKEKS